MTFIETFNKLAKLYEELSTSEQDLPENNIQESAEVEIGEPTEIEAENDFDVETGTDDVDNIDEDAEVDELVLECEKCGALVIKEAKEVVLDEKTDLVNIGIPCEFCEAEDGYIIKGKLVSYAVDLEPETAVEEKEESLEVSKATQNIKECAATEIDN